MDEREQRRTVAGLGGGRYRADETDPKRWSIVADGEREVVSFGPASVETVARVVAALNAAACAGKVGRDGWGEVYVLAATLAQAERAWLRGEVTR